MPRPVSDGTPREIGQIDNGLRDVIRGLVKGEQPWPFFLTGKPGRGKSAAALCLADHVADAVYFRFTMFLRACEAARRDGSGAITVWRPTSTASDEKNWRQQTLMLNEREYWLHLKNAPLVIIDDLATRGGYTEPQYDHLYDLVEERKFKPLMIVSNLPLPQLSDVFDDRIVSRLGRGTIFTLGGPDRRIKRS